MWITRKQGAGRGAPVFLCPQVDKEGLEMIACCEEHIELAIDVYVDKTEQAPEISRIFVDKKKKVCEFCSH